jgi:hypothetical protein
VYLTWVNLVFLPFFSFNEINNLRAFTVAFSSIPTISANRVSSPEDCEARASNVGTQLSNGRISFVVCIPPAFGQLPLSHFHKVSRAEGPKRTGGMTFGAIPLFRSRHLPGIT